MRLDLIQNSTQLSAPSASDMPRRFPENVMMLGTPLAADSSIAGMHRLFQALVIFLAIERVGNRAAGGRADTWSGSDRIF
jgi:hypothetical protein